MPWSNNSGNGSSGGGGKNPWGNGSGGGRGNGGGGGGDEPPNLDELFKQSQERLRSVLGGGGGGNRGAGGGRGSGGPSPKLMFGVAALAGLAIWVFASVFQVEQNEKAVVLTFGEYTSTRGPGLNFAFWPVQTHEKVQVTSERTVDVGVESVAATRGGRNARRDDGLMLTEDENVVDVSFQIVWNIEDPANYLFNLALPNDTLEAVSEASIREVIGRSAIEPVLKRDRILTQQVQSLIQSTLDGYEAGVNIVRVNFVAVAPPETVVESFDNVTKATQKQEQLQLDADGYQRQKQADARGEAAQVLENAAGYAARVVKEAEGEASRFNSIREEYEKAPLVTRKRLYLETMEKVLGDVDKIILDDNVGGGNGVVPYLPLNELRKGTGQ